MKPAIGRISQRVLDQARIGWFILDKKNAYGLGFQDISSDDQAAYNDVRAMVGKDACFSRRFPSQLQAIEIQRYRRIGMTKLTNKSMKRREIRKTDALQRGQVEPHDE